MAYRYIVAAIYAVVLFLDRLDLTIVNIALPAIAAHFHVLIVDTEWVNNAFLLALALSIPISGWAGDRFGDKRIFILATGLFGLTSLCCGLAPNLSFLIMMRFMQGVAGGLIVPVGMSMVFRAFEPAEYASISSYIFIPSLIAPALAPTLGGLMIFFLDWTWVFLFAIPICVVAGGVSLVLLKEHKIQRSPNLDWLGFILSASALLLAFYILSSLDKQRLDVWSIVGLLLAVFLGYLFLKQEQRSVAPLIDITVFQKKLFLQANLIQLTFQIGHFGSIFLIGIYLQMGVDRSAIVAGMTMGMQALGAICISRTSVRLFNRYSAKLPIMIGLTGIAVLTPMILLIDALSPLWVGFGILFVRGLFSGLCGAPMQAISILGFDDHEVSRASAVFNIIRQLSISFGIALSSVLLGVSLYGDRMSMHYEKSDFYLSFIVISVAVMVGVYVASKLDSEKIYFLLHGKA